MAPQHLLLMLVVNLVWGFTFVAGKWGVTELPPILFTGMRFLLIAMVLIPFLKIHKGQMKALFLIGMFSGALHFSAFYGGMSLAEDASTIAIAIQLGVPFSTIMSVLFLGETIGWKRGAGILLAFGGIMVMSFDPRVFDYIDGMLLAVLAAFMAAVATIFMKRLYDVGVFQLQAWVAVFSFPILFLFSGLTESGQWASVQSAGWMGWTGVIYTAIGASLVGHAGMYYLIQKYDVSLTAPLTLLAPIFGVIFGVTIQGDVITARMAMGGVLTLLGCFIIAVRKRELVDTGP